MQNLIENDPQRPNVDRIRIVMKLCLLWSNVLLCSSDGFHDNLLGTQAEISEFDEGKRLIGHIFRFEEDVFRFEVSVSNAVIVEFLDAFTNL